MEPRTQRSDGQEWSDLDPETTEPAEITLASGIMSREVVTKESAPVTAIVLDRPVVVEDVLRKSQISPVPARHVIAGLLMDRIRSLMSLLTVAVFALTFIVQPFRIPSESMERTLLVGDFLLVNKVVYSSAGIWGWLLPYREPGRQDIVVFRFPLNAEEHVVKRVIGAAGDGIHLLDGVVYRDGTPLDEPYTAQQRPARQSIRTFTEKDLFRDNFPASTFTDPGVDAHWWALLHRSQVNGNVIVPRQQYFVMGDNRNYSRDSRYWGFVPRANIVGMPMLIYFSVREPSRTDKAPPPDDRLGESEEGRFMDFARWDRTLRIVQ